jgi:hypothetical protein
MLKNPKVRKQRKSLRKKKEGKKSNFDVIESGIHNLKTLLLKGLAEGLKLLQKKFSNKWIFRGYADGKVTFFEITSFKIRLG